ncbi:cupin domain-containing protein [Mycolicibacterium sp. A43C]
MDAIALGHVVNQQLDVARTALAGRAARTIYGERAHQLRQTVLALAAGRRLDDHESPGHATLQVLRGRVRLGSAGGIIDGEEGDYLVIPDERHNLVAVEDSAVLLTVAPRR